VVRNRRARRHKRHCRALAPLVLRQELPLPPGRRRLERRESHDAIERPLSSGSQPRRSKLSRPARVWPRFFHHTICASSHRNNSHARYLTSFGRSTPQAYECKSRHAAGIGVRQRLIEWRSSINAIRELIAIMASCALFCLLPDWTGRRFRSVATSRGEIYDRDATGHSSMPRSLSTKDGLYWTSAMHGASTGRLPSRKMNSFASTALPNTAGGI
jgi:hypothetical protein